MTQVIVPVTNRNYQMSWEFRITVMYINFLDDPRRRMDLEDFARGPRPDVHQKHWSSQGSLNLVGQKCQLPNCRMNKMRWRLHSPAEIKDGHKDWWVKEAEGIRVAVTSDTKLATLVTDGTWVSEKICDRSKEHFCGKQQRLCRRFTYLVEDFT